MDIRRAYQTDLSHAQWAQVSRFIPAPKPGGRPVKYPRREIVNAILYLVRSGCQWRMLPHEFPPWKTVYGYFAAWKKDGTLDRLHDELRGDLRQAEGSNASRRPRSWTARRSRRPKKGATRL